MDKILIIKIGALGDVVRTTPILRALKGEITWVTDPAAFPLLEGNPAVRRVVDVRRAGALAGERYRLALNLDEEPLACRIASDVKKRELVGAYAGNSGPAYTDSSAPWFDMGLISRFGKKAADRKKWENRRTYQELMFGMLGLEFRGEEYLLPETPPPEEAVPDLIGLETRSGDRWKGKRWARFGGFEKLLEERKRASFRFRTCPTLPDFVQAVDGAAAVVTTDSLAMHLALALKKKTVALFTCTSFHEIHGYGRMEKVVSPEIERYFYADDPAMKSGESIAPAAVWEALARLESEKTAV